MSFIQLLFIRDVVLRVVVCVVVFVLDGVFVSVNPVVGLVVRVPRVPGLLGLDLRSSGTGPRPGSGSRPFPGASRRRILGRRGLGSRSRLGSGLGPRLGPGSGLGPRLGPGSRLGTRLGSRLGAIASAASLVVVARPRTRSAAGSRPRLGAGLGSGSGSGVSVRNDLDPAAVQLVVVVLLHRAFHVALARKLDDSGKTENKFQCPCTLLNMAHSEIFNFKH
jgi:hypothetical protein